MITGTSKSEFKTIDEWPDLDTFQPIRRRRGEFPVRSQLSRTRARMRSGSRARRKSESFNGAHRRRRFAMRWTVAGLLCVTLLATTTASVKAAPIATYTFGGTITFVNNPGNIDPLWAGVAVGDPWEVSYQFDCMTPDDAVGPVYNAYGPNGIRLGEYRAVTSYSLSIGAGGSPPTDSGSVNPLNTYIRVFDDLPGGTLYYDQYEVSIPMQTGQWFMQLDDSTQTAFSTDELTCCGEIPQPLATYFNAARDFSLFSGFSFSDSINGSVDYHTSICIPEPASLGLMCSSAGLLLLRRWRGELPVLNMPR